MNSPICLLQWLPDDEYRETRAALDLFADKIDIAHFDVRSKSKADQALSEWFLNGSNSQYLFIGSHGVKDSRDRCIGLGSSSTDYVPWSELWRWLGRALYPPVLWLGACRSSYAAAAWTPFPSGPIAVRCVLGFRDDVYPIEIKEILLGLMNFTSINFPAYIDTELPRLRSLFIGTSVEMFYEAHTLAGEDGLVNVDDFQRSVGLTFIEHLRNQK